MDAQSWNRHGMCRWLFFFAIAACIASPFFTTVAKANESGVTWLFEQQGHDGRIAAPADETTAPHASLEALRALRPVTDQADAWVQLRQFVEQASGAGIPDVPRRLIALSLAGESDPEGLAKLRRHQNPDGGFGAEPGQQSSVLDTLDALDALAAAGVNDFDVLQPAIAFVAARQRTDGGFAAAAESPSSVYLTARTVAGLQRYRIEYGLSGVLQAAVDFLAARESDRGWGQTWQNAQALLALLPSTADTGRHAVAVDALRAAQGDDGSWDGSVYATALALRALGLAAAEDSSSSPSSATLLGQVIDSRHGVVVSGGTVTAHGSGAGDWMTTTGPDGRFVLQDLEPGPYTLAFSATGFQTLMRNVELEADQRSDLGAVVLDMEPENALVTGRVADAVTGAGIAATVALQGSGIVTASTGMDGHFALPVPAGAVELSVTATDYEPVHAAAWVEPGDRLLFSPVMSRSGSTETEPSVILNGRLLDAETGFAIPGAVVRVVGTDVMTLSGVDGSFRLTLAAAGQIRVELLHSGYQPITFTLLTTAGTDVDLGHWYLLPDPRSSTTLLGLVTDRESGAPVPGARVSAGPRVAYADPDGHFRIDGIEDLAFEVVADAIGYRTLTGSLVLQQHGWTRLDVSLEPTGIGGIRVVEVVEHQDQYGAFEEARFTVGVENRGEHEMPLVLVASAQGVANDFREDFVVPVPGGGRDATFVLAPGEQVLRTVSWFTGNVPPGLYRMVVQVWTGDRVTVLSEGVGAVAIAETARIGAFAVQPEPRELVRGVSTEVELVATMNNASNVQTILDFDVIVRSPSGQPIHQQRVQLEAEPLPGLQEFSLTRFSHDFDLAGAYPIEILGLTGATVEALDVRGIDVAPNIRVQGTHGLDPGQILPREDAGITVRLRIEGMEDAQ
ncbi:carboxypeptidase regulatory-like domain-containing protein [Thioalkalivibrio sp.]|uniref:carboxypeptidase regulatory-like domain-containing protein n=1 Tax=Thioalkalivibrio sp. TaxID=2093813 RepID=UPI0012D6DCE0|nr:carboxypeptidase regulatory-like domain-containing protein [Thioalkalivibrio sp.]TVP82676.1 MAG: hypothetical protein EA346_02035 [Thioalkalivibrio sp.]